MTEAAQSKEPEAPYPCGRYVLHAPIARGGMATIYVAKLLGVEGFHRLVAAKRLHPQYAENPEFVAMFHDEARIASRIHHPNVVPVLDLVMADDEVILVQEYVHGVPLDRLFRAAVKGGEIILPSIAVAVVAGVLSGLHAAHETKDEAGEPLHIVHRDVSPQNVLVSADGVACLLDFGIAKAQSSAHVTRDGLLKGKVAYMAPEQIRGEPVTPATDVYACGVLLWELLAHRRLHVGKADMSIFAAVLRGELPTVTGALDDALCPVDEDRWRTVTALEPVVARAIATEPSARFSSAAEMLDALLSACSAATPLDVARWVKTLGKDHLERRAQILAASDGENPKSIQLRVTTPPASIAPVSGVQVAPHPTSDAPSTPNAQVTSETVATLTLATRELEALSRRARVAPWLVAAGLLLLSGILIGVLASERAKPIAQPAVLAPIPPAQIASITTSAAENVSPAAQDAPVEAHAEPAPAPPHLRVVSVTPRWIPRSAATTAPPRATMTASPSPPPVSSATAQAANDCAPPFYFEGTKKLYKPGCI